MPLAACAAADPDWDAWGEGYFELLGKRLGGPVLGIALLAASVVAMVGVMCTLVCTTSRALCAMAQLRMLPPLFARLHPISGTPWLAVLINSACIALATLVLRFEALLELSMFFYAMNAIVQCAAVVRLRETHPHRIRPQHTIPAPFLLLPVAIASAMLLASPLRNWLLALGLLGATLGAYALIHFGRMRKGHRPGQPPSARSAAAVEALAVAVPPYGGGGGVGGGAEVDGAEEEGEEGGQTTAHSTGSTRIAAGDAWFTKLVASYRRVPDEERQQAEEVHAHGVAQSAHLA